MNWAKWRLIDLIDSSTNFNYACIYTPSNSLHCPQNNKEDKYITIHWANNGIITEPTICLRTIHVINLKKQQKRKNYCSKSTRRYWQRKYVWRTVDFTVNDQVDIFRRTCSIVILWWNNRSWNRNKIAKTQYNVL